MATLYLVRHGEAAAHWTAAADPDLSPLGHEQAHAAAQALAPRGPLPIFSSPLARARQTAVPLEKAWQSTVRIAAAVAEIPTPIPLDARSDWLMRLKDGTWSTAERELQSWRSAVLDFLMRLESNAVIYSHYVAINVAVGAALDRDEIYVCQPAHASITVIETDGGRLRMIEQGAQNATSAGARPVASLSPATSSMTATLRTGRREN